ncbi:MAG: hypothetical protein V4581_08230 [Bacteroidota bacterium]
MKYIVILAAILLVVISCKSQNEVASASNFKALNEVESTSMEAQNYNTKMRPFTDTIRIERVASNFKSIEEVKGVDMGAQNYNNARFSTDTIYFEKIAVDSLKN